MYMYDLSVTVGKKFAYADDLTILHYATNWQSLEGTLTQDMATQSFTFTNGSSSLANKDCVGSRAANSNSNSKNSAIFAELELELEK